MSQPDPSIYTALGIDVGRAAHYATRGLSAGEALRAEVQLQGIDVRTSNHQLRSLNRADTGRVSLLKTAYEAAIGEAYGHQPGLLAALQQEYSVLCNSAGPLTWLPKRGH